MTFPLCPRTPDIAAHLDAPRGTLAAGERKRLLWLVSEQSADVEAYRAELILRLGPFGPDSSVLSSRQDHARIATVATR